MQLAVDCMIVRGLEYIGGSCLKYDVVDKMYLRIPCNLQVVLTCESKKQMYINCDMSELLTSVYVRRNVCNFLLK